jgi:hypothetical protein
MTAPEAGCASHHLIGLAHLDGCLLGCSQQQTTASVFMQHTQRLRACRLCLFWAQYTRRFRAAHSTLYISRQWEWYRVLT